MTSALPDDDLRRHPLTSRSCRSGVAARAFLSATLVLAAWNAGAQPTGDLQPVEPLNPLDRVAPQTDTQPDLQPAPVAPVEFSPDPVFVSQFGLKFRVPEGWTTEQLTREFAPAEVVEVDPRGGQRRHLDIAFDPLRTTERRVVYLASPERTVGMRIHTPTAGDASATLDQLAHTLAQKVVDAAAAGSGASVEGYAVFEKDASLRIAGRDAYRFYMRIPRRAGEQGLVLGYTLMDLPGEAFLVLEMVATEEYYLPGRAAYETVVAAMEFVSAASIDARRWPLMLAASRFIASRTPDDYQDAMDAIDGRIERLYNPGGLGDNADDRERGVRFVYAWRGMRGEIDPDRDQGRFNDAEREEGYLVMVAGRFFDEMEDPVTGERRRVTADYAARYWMSLDRRREAWLNKMLIQTPLYRRPVPFTEVGAREGDSLTIWTKAPGEPDRVITPLFETQGYLSQVEFFLFADMLARAGMPMDFGYYAWQTGPQTCRFIQDSPMPEGDGLAWTIVRTFGEGEEIHRIAFDGEQRWRGTLREIGQTLTRGEPTDTDRLIEIWRAKNLPIENVRDPGPARPGPGGSRLDRGP